MTESSQIAPGMTISLKDKLYRVESCVKVTMSRGTPFIKTKLRDLATEEILEKNFKVDQKVEDVRIAERTLEFLYQEGQDFLFLDLDELEQVRVEGEIVGERANFLKEGIQAQATLYGPKVFSLEVPQFLELMVVKTEDSDELVPVANATKGAVLETGASVDVPLFIESGDIIKVDTRSSEYIQRV